MATKVSSETPSEVLPMVAHEPKKGRLSPLGVFKEVFNWYPKEYPAEEKK